MRRKPYKRKSEGKYYIDFYEIQSDGTKARRTRSTGTTDFGVAKQILKEKQSLAALGKFSVSAPVPSIAMKEAVSKYCMLKKAGKVGTDWLRMIEISIEECFSVANTVEHVEQIKTEHLEIYVSWMIDKGLADNTRGKRERIIRKFAEWMFSRKMLTAFPFQGLEKITTKPQPVMLRRMVLPEEMDWIQHSLETVPETEHHKRKAGRRERLACYLLAIRTGFRSSEIAALRVSDFSLGGATPHVELGGRFTKNKEPARQYIDAKLAKRMASHFSSLGLSSSDKAFRLPTRRERSNMFRRDVERARQAWIEADESHTDEDFLQAYNSRGEVLNFHCLRHTCGAWLAHAGINPKTIQSIMRHESITLTMDTYGHLFPNSESDAVAKTAFFSDSSRKSSLSW